MLFRSATVILSAFALVQSVAAQAVTPAQVVSDIGVVTAASRKLNSLLVAFSDVPTSLQAQQISQTVVGDFAIIINHLSSDVTSMNGPYTPFNDADAGLVVVALNDFVKVYQTTLATLIKKHSPFAQNGVTAPIARVLSQSESAIDTFVLSLYGRLPTQVAIVQSARNALERSTQAAIKVYSQVCIPSLHYPSIQPACRL